MDLAFFCTRVTKMPAKMQHYKVPCSHVQPVVTVVTVVVHCTRTRAQLVQSPVQAMSTTEMLRVKSRGEGCLHGAYA